MKRTVPVAMFVIIAIFAMGAALDPDAILNAIFDKDLKAINVNLLHESYPAVDEIAISGTLTVGGNSALNGGISVDSTAFTVANSTGDITTAGRLDVVGSAGFENVTTNQNMIVKGSTALNGGLTMDFDKFVVADATGNTTIAGTLETGAKATLDSVEVTGAAALNGGLAMDVTAFTVANTTGNVATSGTLQVTGATALNGGITSDSTAFTVADTTGNVATTGTLTVGSTARVDSSVFLKTHQYIYYRQTAGADTNGDWRTYANLTGIYYEHREGGAWVLKMEVE